MEKVCTPDDPALAELCGRLAELAPQLDAPGARPLAQLALCADAGVFEWFIGPEWGGQSWSEADLLRGYMQLASACLTTTFVITQRMGAVSRIASSRSEWARQCLLPSLVRGRYEHLSDNELPFATVGISHLTTSRQHLATPVLEAEESNQGFVLNGYSPWVTGAEFAQHLVLGATLGDGRQILVVVPIALKGVCVEPAPELIGLTASRTGRVRLDRVDLDRRWLLAGPVHDVMKQGLGAKTGGLQTSALAVGLARAAIEYMEREQVHRTNLSDPTDALRIEHDCLRDDLLQVADGTAACTSDEVRSRANSLALRASQAALAAAKGAGYMASHPAGRWCREALFFLVWSCPQNVLAANLCELAGL
jgi:alkylation response protein AidB-like acyl-CoA dehydrogenase